MCMNEINWTKKALKQLRKIQKQDRVKIVIASDELKDFSDSKNVKPLANHQYGYRLRVGNFRVLFNFETQVNIVNIEEVKKRNESTY